MKKKYDVWSYGSFDLIETKKLENEKCMQNIQLNNADNCRRERVDSFFL
jgi:hypothetical protein